MAISSSADPSVKRAPLGGSLLRRALPFGYQGALVAAALIALPPTGAVYESVATLEIKTAAPQSGTPSAAQMVEEYVLKLVAETDKRAQQPLGCAGGEPRSSVLHANDRKLSVHCRADVAQVAQRQCEALVKRTSAHFQAFEVAGRTTNAVRTLGTRLLALGFGLGLGLAWVFLRVELRAASERRNAPVRPSGTHGRISSPRPVAPPRSRRSRADLENARTDIRPRFDAALQPPATGEVTRAQRPKPGLDRTIVGTGPGVPAIQFGNTVAAPRSEPVAPVPAKPVIDTIAESIPTPSAANAADPAVKPGGSGAPASGVHPSATNRSTRPGHSGGSNSSWRPNQENLLAPYETTSRWSPDPAISASTTRAELRALCDQLYMLAAKGCFVIRVSSDPPSASLKSHIAAQLAWSLADFGHARVLLLEADFDDPSVHRVMRLETPAFKGFSQQLYLRITSGERVPWSVARCAPCLSVLPEGRVRTPGLLHTAQFSSALAELRRYYDILVVDGPSAASSADTRALDGVADGVVFAVTAGAGSSDGLKLASELFGDKSLLWIVHTQPTTAGP